MMMSPFDEAVQSTNHNNQYQNQNRASTASTAMGMGGGFALMKKTKWYLTGQLSSSPYDGYNPPPMITSSSQPTSVPVVLVSDIVEDHHHHHQQQQQQHRHNPNVRTDQEAIVPPPLSAFNIDMGSGNIGDAATSRNNAANYSPSTLPSFDVSNDNIRYLSWKSIDSFSSQSSNMEDLVQGVGHQNTQKKRMVSAFASMCIILFFGYMVSVLFVDNIDSTNSSDWKRNKTSDNDATIKSSSSTPSSFSSTVASTILEEEDEYNNPTVMIPNIISNLLHHHNHDGHYLRH